MPIRQIFIDWCPFKVVFSILFQIWIFGCVSPGGNFYWNFHTRYLIVPHLLLVNRNIYGMIDVPVQLKVVCNILKSRWIFDWVPENFPLSSVGMMEINMEGCIDSPPSILVLAAVMMVGKLNYMKDTSRYVLCARISPNTTCQSFVIELHEGHI